MNRAFDCDDAGMVWPLVDSERCLGDAGCVSVCPYDVLALQPVDAASHDDLPESTRFLLSLSGGLQAVVVAPERCRACGLCLAVCSQDAIDFHGRNESDGG
ncbi:MAG: 4Fe-4S dicluster domain-containing protein [Rudaea sp.]|uniref:4Fe-4S dicluster domain-containing protein n=1 Tax=unclassified Rudaea TaxID=2627037 RepID=UPI0014850E3E|nr:MULTISPECIES: 4Fe-4S dicluster domain-containing protein [unclassified Rudaea]MBN8886340.1 4Fe-4S dicluster domain-containing protein [Rudaea sp.]